MLVSNNNAKEHCRSFFVVFLLLLAACRTNGEIHGTELNMTFDLTKCNAGFRDFCPPIVRCWVGVIEVDCNGPDTDHTLKGGWIGLPRTNLTDGEPFWAGWSVAFKNQSDGGALKNPWVSHTNVHIAPADVGALAPPTNHPLRKDSLSLTGGPGPYWMNMTLPEGVWLIMAHIRIQDKNDPGAQQYEMTIDIVRTVGNPSDQTPKTVIEETKKIEQFCSIYGKSLFSDCDDLRRAWVASFSGLIAFFFLLWLQSFFFAERMSHGGLSLKFEVKKITIVRFFLAIFLAYAVIMTNNQFLAHWIQTNREPSRVATKNSDPLQFPNVLLCPFSSTGKIKILSAVHYPNLYGLSAHHIKTVRDHEINLVDTEGTEIRRICSIVDMEAHHKNIQLNVTSEFTTLMLKTIVQDPVRTDTEGFGDVMAVLFDELEELSDTQKFTINLIMVGQSFATYTTLSPRKFVDINGNVSESFLFTTNAISNPYLRNRDPICQTASSEGLCQREAVLMINWKTLQTEQIQEKTILNIFTVCTLMVGVISGCRMLLEVITNLLEHMWHGALDKEFVHYLIGGHDPYLSELAGPRPLTRRNSSVGQMSFSESLNGDSSFCLDIHPQLLAQSPPPKPRRASLSQIVQAVRERKTTNERQRLNSFTPSNSGGDAPEGQFHLLPTQYAIGHAISGSDSVYSDSAMPGQLVYAKPFRQRESLSPAESPLAAQRARRNSYSPTGSTTAATSQAMMKSSVVVTRMPLVSVCPSPVVGPSPGRLQSGSATQSNPPECDTEDFKGGVTVLHSSPVEMRRII